MIFFEDGCEADLASITMPNAWGPIPVAPAGWTWETLMDRALELACRTAGLPCVRASSLYSAAGSGNVAEPPKGLPDVLPQAQAVVQAEISPDVQAVVQAEISPDVLSGVLPQAQAAVQAEISPDVLPQAQAEVPVGALVVTPDGEIVGEGANASIALHDPSAHAEIVALRAAGQRLGNYRMSGCVLVVTLEPCLMCVGAIAHARLAGVVYGAGDARAGAVSSLVSGFDLAQHAKNPAHVGSPSLWHMGGVRAGACAALLRDFFAARRQPR